MNSARTLCFERRGNLCAVEQRFSGQLIILNVLRCVHTNVICSTMIWEVGGQDALPFSRDTLKLLSGGVLRLPHLEGGQALHSTRPPPPGLPPPRLSLLIKATKHQNPIPPQRSIRDCSTEIHQVLPGCTSYRCVCRYSLRGGPHRDQ